MACIVVTCMAKSDPSVFLPIDKIRVKFLLASEQWPSKSGINFSRWEGAQIGFVLLSRAQHACLKLHALSNVATFTPLRAAHHCKLHVMRPTCSRTYAMDYQTDFSKWET